MGRFTYGLIIGSLCGVLAGAAFDEPVQRYWCKMVKAYNCLAGENGKVREDTNGDGVLDKAEFRESLRTAGRQAKNGLGVVASNTSSNVVNWIRESKKD